MRIARHDGGSRTLALALLFFVGALAFAINNSARGSGIRSLDQGDGPTAPMQAAPASTTEQMIWSLQKGIRRAPANVDAYAALGAAYVQRARETGDPTYYGKAEAVFAGALKRDPDHVEALIGKGTLALARHDFRAALALGEQARVANPKIARIYGVIGDAQIELGMYDQAVQTIQMMVDMRPDLSSYSRVSYLRELYGDLPGATEAMQAAVRAGGANAENTQWVRVQLGHLHFNQGNLALAEREYAQALAQLPDYVPALAGLAQVRAAEGRYDAAVELYTRATQRMPLPEYVIALGDLYAKIGDQEQAQRQYELVQAIDRLLAENGVNTELETALFFADHDIDLPASLAKARAAYAERKSIHTADGLAWTLYKTGSYQEAQRYAVEALKLGTRDALKLFHAGMIAKALGEEDQARAHLQAAIALNPHFSLLHADRALATLDELGTASEGDK